MAIILHLIVRVKIFFAFRKKDNNCLINQGTIKRIRIRINGKNNRIIIKKGSYLSEGIFNISGDNHLIIINENTYIKKAIFWLEDCNGELNIGNQTHIEDIHLAITEPYSRIDIGSDCLFSNEIIFRTGDSHSIIDVHTSQRINFAENIRIGNHVWIGSRAIVLKGSIVEDNCVISTGAIVTSHIPSNSIAAGIPAKVLKSGITWQRERIYDTNK